MVEAALGVFMEFLTLPAVMAAAHQCLTLLLKAMSAGKPVGNCRLGKVGVGPGSQAEAGVLQTMGIGVACKSLIGSALRPTA